MFMFLLVFRLVQLMEKLMAQVLFYTYLLSLHRKRKSFLHMVQIKLALSGYITWMVLLTARIIRAPITQEPTILAQIPQILKNQISKMRKNSSILLQRSYLKVVPTSLLTGHKRPIVLLLTTLLLVPSL